jgi:hypothetical protein
MTDLSWTISTGLQVTVEPLSMLTVYTSTILQEISGRHSHVTPTYNTSSVWTVRRISRRCNTLNTPKWSTYCSVMSHYVCSKFIKAQSESARLSVENKIQLVCVHQLCQELFTLDRNTWIPKSKSTGFHHIYSQHTLLYLLNIRSKVINTDSLVFMPIRNLIVCHVIIRRPKTKLAKVIVVCFR